MKRVYIKTLGCKVNTFDSHALENKFRAKGYSVSDSPDNVDITVINTCSVTAAAEKEARYLLRRYRRVNPNAVQVVTGCYAQINSMRLKTMDEVDFVVPNEAKEQLVDLLSHSEIADHFEDKLPKGVKAVLDNRQSHFKSSLTLFDNPTSSQTRTFIKIQDGCNGFCSYCQIPYARGASRSVHPDEIYTQVKNLVELGTKEIVFTGIHIGDYGRDLAITPHDSDSPFISLLSKILELKNLTRLRLSSLEPSELTLPLIKLMSAHKSKFCDHFHLPLQSGSDRILKLMRRQYNCARYLESVQMIRQYFPDAHISADVIPGFPGENEDDFCATIDFIKTCDFASLHIFPYSKRPNTAALKLPDHLEPSIIKQRAHELRALSSKLLQNFNRRYLGKTMEVLWENDFDAKGRILGKTRNYLKVAAASNNGLAPGMESHTVLKGFCADNLILGQLCAN